MSEVITCPQCGRQLRVPEDLIGHQVKCPACEATFTAALGSAPRPSAPDTYSIQEEPIQRPTTNRSDYDEEPRDHSGRGRRFAREDEPYAVPHRGTLVLTLGILSLVFACCPLAGWVLGGIAIARANEDLRAMNRGEMDREGLGLTQAGKICAILGIVFSTLAFCGNIVLRMKNLG